MEQLNQKGPDNHKNFLPLDEDKKDAIKIEEIVKRLREIFNLNLNQS